MLYLNLDAMREKDFENRYDPEKFIPFTSNVYDILDSFFVKRVKTLPLWGQLTVRGEEFRPDLLSHRLYGLTVYWQILMVYNDYLSVLDIKEGGLVKAPALDAIEELYFSLNTLQKTSYITRLVL